ncbi:hypothetical protein ACUH93_07020 [Dermabacteraceae bacterium P7006]
MDTPKSAAIIATTDDSDLLRRAKALAPMKELTAAEVEREFDAFALTEVDEKQERRIAHLYDDARVEYERAVAALPPRPGLNEKTISDAHILHALSKLKERLAQ